MIYCLDTDVCIDFLRLIHEHLRDEILSHCPGQIRIPSIVKAELLVGAKKSKSAERNLRVVEDFLASFEIIPFGDIAAEFYADIRVQLESEGRPIGHNDLVVAATAVSVSSVLVTRNVREFGRIPLLRVENWIDRA